MKYRARLNIPSGEDIVSEAYEETTGGIFSTANELALQDLIDKLVAAKIIVIEPLA